jgi:hypothetical protein
MVVGYKDLIPFVSSDDLAAFTGLTINASDLKTKIALDSACDAVRSYLGQDINLVEDDVEWHSGHGYLHDRIRLRQRPVVAITEVRIDVVAGSTGTVLAAANYNVRDSFIVRTDASYWLSGNDNIKVTYDHGWVIPPVSASASVPADIRLVALSAARRVYSGVGAADASGFGGERIGDYEYTNPKGTATSVAELIMAEMDVLDRYRIGLVP